MHPTLHGVITQKQDPYWRFVPPRGPNIFNSVTSKMSTSVLTTKGELYRTNIRCFKNFSLSIDDGRYQTQCRSHVSCTKGDAERRGTGKSAPRVCTWAIVIHYKLIHNDHTSHGISYSSAFILRLHSCFLFPLTTETFWEVLANLYIFSIQPLLQYAFMVRCLVKKHRDNFTF
jgi:hypothetical protein